MKQCLSLKTLRKREVPLPDHAITARLQHAVLRQFSCFATLILPTTYTA